MPLGKNADAGDYVKDFQKSDAPQFKGKSKEKRRKMAIAAYLDSKDKKESKMKSFDDIKSEINEAKYKVEIDGGIETVTARTEKEAIRKAARKQGNSMSVGKSFGPKVKVKKISEGAFTKKAVETGKVKTGPSKDRMAAMQKQDDNRPTLRKNEAKIECPKCAGDGCDHCDGKGYHIKEGKKMDSAAMKKAMDVFKKRGGKIKKVAPGKAAGYHGKDDPGAGVQGMMDRGDTKGMPRKKKIRSMR